MDSNGWNHMVPRKTIQGTHAGREALATAPERMSFGHKRLAVHTTLLRFPLNNYNLLEGDWQQGLNWEKYFELREAEVVDVCGMNADFLFIFFSAGEWNQDFTCKAKLYWATYPCLPPSLLSLLPFFFSPFSPSLPLLLFLFYLRGENSKGSIIANRTEVIKGYLITLLNYWAPQPCNFPPLYRKLSHTQAQWCLLATCPLARACA